MTEHGELRVLIAALHLDGPSGRRVRALVEALRDGGHRPLVYAPFAEESSLERAPVLTDLKPGSAFDVAHALSPLVGAIVRARLPETPMIVDASDAEEATQGVDVDALVSSYRAATRDAPQAPALSGEDIEEALAEVRRGRVRERQRAERRIWELQQFHDAVRDSAWHSLGRSLRRFVNLLFPWGTRRRAVLNVLRGRPATPVPHSRERYEVWHRRHFNRRALRRRRRDARDLSFRPSISIVVPAYNGEPAWLRDVVRTIRDQIYPEWELCIADDASTRPETREALRELATSDPRIKVRFLDRNTGISGASNAALAMATGEFVALVDHDDLLRPEALYEVVRLLNEQPDLDYVYTDEDKMDVDGRLVEPFFKPDWAPDLLLSMNYLSHLSVLRRELVERVGGFRSEYDGSQDYDLVLRVTEATDRIAHVPLPLYTWRKVPGSAAESEDAKPWAYEAARRALEDALRRRRVPGRVDYGAFPGMYRPRYPVRGRPSVSIVVPTRDRVDLLRPCLESIRERSTYGNYGIVVVDNRSTDPETIEYLASLEERVIPYPEEFNFARIMNAAAEQTEGDLLLFLNNDTRVIEPEWIEALLEHAVRSEVAAAGARLLLPDGAPQHLGVVVGPGQGLAENVAHEEFRFADCVHNRSAVTAACMMTRREVFRELGGFEERFQVAYNDVDYCLRAREKGHLIVCTPYATLYHDEGSSRIRGTQPASDAELFRERWAGYRDPYYNPNLDLDDLYAIRL